METRKIFEQIMQESKQIALASSLGDQPNVRLMGFSYKNGIVYLTTVENSPKVQEFGNPKVAFTTLLTTKGIVKVSAGLVRPSKLSIEEFQAIFGKKLTKEEASRRGVEEQLVVYEISFSQALMTTKEGLEIVEMTDL